MKIDEGTENEIEKPWSTFEIFTEVHHLRVNKHPDKIFMTVSKSECFLIVSLVGSEQAILFSRQLKSNIQREQTQNILLLLHLLNQNISFKFHE